MRNIARTLLISAAASLLLAGAAQAEISVSNPFSRASAPQAKAGAAFLTLNIDAGADKLVGASSPVADKAELHAHLMEGGVARMRPVEGGIAVNAGTPTELKPGGLHIMLMGLKAPLKQGDSFPLTLTFEKAGEVAVTVPVQGPGAMGPMQGQDHGSHGDHAGHQH
ncbi:copper chaperone PCu(A)C [Niveispirillum sp.]|uniref:copper chaperone PCu(A)C n=1 Tax=Niveispirillum sp. TaxID=1917217 RepID=UPI001B6FE9B3|nr:copper chaperone PCu(A)C [Niveispirillum sp.]MBP7339904.1 copper chaperone PCu(A)C [Niveispirillum sp.]